MSTVPINPYMGISFPWEKTEDVTIMGGHAHFLQGDMAEFESEDDASEGHDSRMYGDLAAARSSGTFSAPPSRSAGPSSTVGSVREYSPDPQEASPSQPVQQQNPNLTPMNQQHLQFTEEPYEWSHNTVQPTENAHTEKTSIESAQFTKAACLKKVSPIERKPEASKPSEKATVQKAFVEHAPTQRAPIEVPPPQETTMGFDDFERVLLREHMEPHSSTRATKVTRISSDAPAPQGERRSMVQPAHVADEQQEDETMYEDPPSIMPNESTRDDEEAVQGTTYAEEATAHGVTEQVPVNVQDEPESVYSPSARSPEAEEEEEPYSPVDFSNVPEMRTTKHTMYSFNPHERTALENSIQVSKEPEPKESEAEKSYDGLGISGTRHVGTEPEHSREQPASHNTRIVEETPPIRPKTQRTTAAQVPTTSGMSRPAPNEDMNRTLKNKASRFFRSVWSGNKSKRFSDTPEPEPMHDASGKQRRNIRDRLRPRNVRCTAPSTAGFDKTPSHYGSVETPTAPPMRRMNRDVPSPYYSPAVSSHPSPGSQSQSLGQAPPKETQANKTPLGFLFKKRASDVNPVRPTLSHKASNGILPMRDVNEEPTPVETEMRRNESILRSRRRIHSVSNMTSARENTQEHSEEILENQPGLPPVMPTNEPGLHAQPHSTVSHSPIDKASRDAAMEEPVAEPSNEAPVTESMPVHQSTLSATDEEKVVQEHNTANPTVDAPSLLPLSAEGKRLSLGLDEDSWALDLNFETQMNTGSTAAASPVSVQNNPFLARP